MLRALLLSVVAVLATFSVSARGADQESEPEALSWSWDEGEPRRWYVLNEVTLPHTIWFLADRNDEARVVAWQVRMVFTCEPDRVRRRAADLDCTIDDIGLQAAATRADAGKLQPILDEVQAKLEGLSFEMVQRRNGRIRTVQPVGLPTGTRRMGRMNETLRIVLMRAVAGLDLQLPRGPQDAWVQRGGLLLMAPSTTGTHGGFRVTHQRAGTRDGEQVIQSAGKGTMTPVSDQVQNHLDTELIALGTFDADGGALGERLWRVRAHPTASAAAAQGAAGISYVQQGRIQPVTDPDDLPDVGPTREVAPPGVIPSTLQQWPDIAGRMRPLDRR